MVRTSNNEGLGTWNSNPNRSYMMGRVCSNHTTWQTTMSRFGVQPEASDFRSTRSSAEDPSAEDCRLYSTISSNHVIDISPISTYKTHFSLLVKLDTTDGDFSKNRGVLLLPALGPNFIVEFIRSCIAFLGNSSSLRKIFRHNRHADPGDRFN